MAPGGILAIHDVGWKCSYVMMAVRDWLRLGLERWAWWGQADSLLVLQRVAETIIILEGDDAHEAETDPSPDAREAEASPAPL